MLSSFSIITLLITNVFNNEEYTCIKTQYKSFAVNYLVSLIWLDSQFE